jgi:hypothetical protein
MKPRIGRKVYCVYHDGIFVDAVGYVGKDSFIVESVLSGTNEDSWEWFYEQYGKDWFTSLAKAKKELLSRFEEEGMKLKVFKINDNYYELG